MHKSSYCKKNWKWQGSAATFVSVHIFTLVPNKLFAFFFLVVLFCLPPPFFNGLFIFIYTIIFSFILWHRCSVGANWYHLCSIASLSVWVVVQFEYSRLRKKKIIGRKRHNLNFTKKALNMIYLYNQDDAKNFIFCAWYTMFIFWCPRYMRFYSVMQNKLFDKASFLILPQVFLWNVLFTYIS